ncbi:MAG TPA: porin family protein [Draconibacterium sp.]|nr:porin family protein [Draconibacterium sp.]
MKKLLALFLYICILQSCAAPEKMPREYQKEARIIGALGAADVNGGKSWSPRIGGQVGVETKIHKLKNNSSVGAGLGVSFQGASYEEDMYSGKVNMTYLNIPLLYTYESNVGIYGEAGLQPGILLSAKDKFYGGSYNYRDYMKTFDLGLPIGAGYNINENLSIGARVTFGLLNIDNSGSDVKDHNFLITGLVRYKLHLPSKKTEDK